jgi:hypothetical protein
MRAVLFVSCLAVAALAALAAPATNTPTVDSFIVLMKEVEHQQFFMVNIIYTVHFTCPKTTTVYMFTAQSKP